MEGVKVNVFVDVGKGVLVGTNVKVDVWVKVIVGEGVKVSVGGAVPVEVAVNDWV